MPKEHQVVAADSMKRRKEEVGGGLMIDAMRLGKALEAPNYTSSQPGSYRRPDIWPTLVFAAEISHEDRINMAERMGVQVILFYGENDNQNRKRKDIRATSNAWQSATLEQQQKNPGQFPKNKKFDKFFNLERIEPISSSTIVLTTLQTWRGRTTEEVPLLDKDGESTGKPIWTNRLEGKFERVVVDEVHYIRAAGDKRENFNWWGRVKYSVKARYRWLMSANSMSNQGKDLQGLLGILYREEWNSEYEMADDFNVYWDIGEEYEISLSKGLLTSKWMCTDDAFVLRRLVSDTKAFKPKALDEVQKLGILRSIYRLAGLRRTFDMEFPVDHDTGKKESIGRGLLDFFQTIIDLHNSTSPLC